MAQQTQTDEDSLAEKLRSLEEGDEVTLHFNGRSIGATVDSTERFSEVYRSDEYYRNGKSVEQKVTFETSAGDFYARCFWWPNHSDEDLQMDGGLQVPNYRERQFLVPAYSFSMEVKADE